MNGSSHAVHMGLACSGIGVRIDCGALGHTFRSHCVIMQCNALPAYHARGMTSTSSCTVLRQSLYDSYIAHSKHNVIIVSAVWTDLGHNAIAVMPSLPSPPCINLCFLSAIECSTTLWPATYTTVPESIKEALPAGLNEYYAPPQQVSASTEGTPRLHGTMRAVYLILCR